MDNVPRDGIASAVPHWGGGTGTQVSGHLEAYQGSSFASESLDKDSAFGEDLAVKAVRFAPHERIDVASRAERCTSSASASEREACGEGENCAVPTATENASEHEALMAWPDVWRRRRWGKGKACR